ncbi:hypothetical protein NT2_04_04210 [Caenibius tardaugens NBRC 16725]|uniref:Uncharacterized protein n=1 Tax=Caenibius tardaugens NBRC 16725 TaxID=1219035 RepID=U3A2M7_9SPHN|nr:hypothetical protein [Caenibius tardaugens]GAD49008.1 hypothetical protein NT2_04_04210 [Caenibius tardaugens NBRC 16725]
MNDKPAALSREERLAAKLRENLRRRKAQAREINAIEDGSNEGSDKGGTHALSKEPRKS